jgi:hypothetical protein
VHAGIDHAANAAEKLYVLKILQNSGARDISKLSQYPEEAECVLPVFWDKTTPMQ